MPLYECSVCHAVENTALTNFWWDVMRDKKPALCSECDPEIGTWHGHFPKTTVEEFRRQFPHAKIQYELSAVSAPAAKPDHPPGS